MSGYGKIYESSNWGVGVCDNTIGWGSSYKSIANCTDASFSYPLDSYPTNGTDPTPTITGDAGGTFTATPSGLTLNASTGEITLSTSTVNSYTIRYSLPDTTFAEQTVGITAALFASTRSFSFDGVNDYFETSSTFSMLNGLSNFAFSFWFKAPSFNNTQIFFIDGTSADSRYGQVQLVLGPNYLIGYFNNVSYYVQGNNNLVADTWYHVLLTRDNSRGVGDKARIYIDGVNESFYDSSRYLGTLDTATSGLKIGDGDFRSPFLGNIDEFAVYNQDMASYISEIYTGSPNNLNNLPTAPSPNAWYRCGE